MRVITVLTVVATMLIIPSASAATGQTDETHSTNKQLIQKYDALVSHNNQIARKYLCKGTKSYLIQKRAKTWEWQQASYVPRTRTSYNERRMSCSPHLKWIAQLWATRADAAFHFYADLNEPQEAICHVFGNYCTEALVVSECESGYSVYAHNGQYLGLFQMGSSERELYGHGGTALAQAVAAYRYFVASGKDWSPWSCKPH